MECYIFPLPFRSIPGIRCERIAASGEGFVGCSEIIFEKEDILLRPYLGGRGTVSLLPFFTPMTSHGRDGGVAMLSQGKS